MSEEAEQAAFAAYELQFVADNWYLPKSWYQYTGDTPLKSIPYEDAKGYLSRHGAQMHIYRLQNNVLVKVTTVPPVVNLKLKQLFLMETYNTKTNTFHVDFINRPVQLFNKFGRECILCKKTVRSQGAKYRHKCESDSNRFCSVCRRSVLNPSDKVSDMLLPLFCKKLIDTKRPSVCKKCNKLIETADCSANHMSIHCVRSWQCLLCKRTYKTMNTNDQSKVAAEHKCDIRTCPHCREKFFITTQERHFCKLAKPDRQHNHPNLVFINIMYYQEDNEGLLRFEPYLAVMYQETKKGIFEEYVFSEDGAVYKESGPKIGQGLNFSEGNAKYWPDDNDCIFNHKLPKGSYGHHLKEPADVFVWEKFLDNPLYQIFEFMFLRKKNTFYNSTVLVHSSTDLKIILAALTKLDIVISTITKEYTVIGLNLRSYGISFLVLKEYINQTKIDMRRNFLPASLPLWFPFGAIRKSKEQVPFPKLAHFISRTDTKQDREEKEACALKLLKEQNSWDLAIELEKFALNDLKCQLRTTLDYLRNCFKFERELRQEFFNLADSVEENKNRTLRYNHPFTTKTATVASATYHLFSYYCLAKENVLAVNYEHTGVPATNCSKPEMEWIYYLNQRAPPGQRIVTAQNCGMGLPQFNTNARPDGYCYETKTVYYFHGCLFHGHECQYCPYTNKRKRDVCNPSEFPYKNMNELKKKSDDTIKHFLNANKDCIDKVEIIYQCQWEFQKKTERLVRETLQGFNLPITRKRLIPRDSLAGGLFETYSFAYLKEVGNSFHVLDVNSLYPFIAASNVFPAGKPAIYRHQEIQAVKFDPSASKFDIKFAKKDTFVKLWGLAQVQVFAPQQLKRPVLSFVVSRTINEEYTVDGKTKTYVRKSNKRMWALCYTCSKEQILTDCPHSLRLRSWEGTYTSDEINYAGKMGYQFTFIEIYQYPGECRPFKKFINMIASFKLKNSGMPSSYRTFEEKKSYCDTINKEMDFTGQLSLRPENVVRNDGNKSFAKLQLNSLLGKLAQSNKPSKTRLANKKSDLLSFAFPKEENPSLVLLNYDILSDHACLLHLQSSSMPSMNRKGNVVLYSFVTAGARLYMMEKMDELEKKTGATIYAISTDCIFFSAPLNSPLRSIFFLGPSFGCFKEEYTRVTAFFTLGPKNYMVQYINKEGDLESVVKMSGIFLTIYARQMLTNSAYRDMVLGFLQNKLYELEIPNKILKVDQKGCAQERCFGYTIRNFLYRNRQVRRLWLRQALPDKIVSYTKTKTLYTLPYGYNEQADPP